MQISREFISLGGKQNKKTPKPAFSPRSTKLPAPRPPPRPRRCPRSPGGVLHGPLLLSLQSVAVFANTDIAVHVQRIINSHCGDAVRQGTRRAALRAATGIASLAHTRAHGCPRRQRAAGGTLDKHGASPRWAVLDGFLSCSTSSWFLCC